MEILFILSNVKDIIFKHTYTIEFTVFRKAHNRTLGNKKNLFTKSTCFQYQKNRIKSIFYSLNKYFLSM